MKYYLLKYADNWADEMDIDGHTVLGEKKYKDFNDALENVKDFCFVIGTNEDIQYRDKSEVEDVIEITILSEDQYVTLQSLDLLESGFASSFITQLLENE